MYHIMKGVTDAAGNYSNKLPAGGGSLCVKAANYVQTLSQVDAFSEEPIRITMTKKGGGTIRGKVKDSATGKPASAVKVRALPVLPHKPSSSEGVTSFPLFGIVESTVSDAEGRFVLPLLPEAKFRMLASDAPPGYDFVTTAANETMVELKAGETKEIPDLVH